METTIGKYKIEGVLYSGNFFTIYLGVDPKSNKPIAIKTLTPAYANNASMIKRFLKERKIISLTDHPNIVKVLDQGEWEDGLYLAMEFIQGISLKQFIFQHSLSLKRSLEIILQVASALSHLHAHGVVHGDLKPENILITESGVVKIIDFGIAALHEEKEPLEEGGIVGTPAYMSPEQKESPSNLSYLSDIYSLGVIAYELITGKLSYGSIQSSLLPDNLRPIIEKTIAFDPKKRYQDIVDFIKAIADYIKSADIEKDRPETDKYKELIESLEQTQINLSPQNIPHFSNIEIGVAKYKTPEPLSFYYDFFKLTETSYLFIIAESVTVGMISLAHLSYARGIIRTLVEYSEKKNYNPLEFVKKLNNIISKDYFSHHLALSLLFLDKEAKELSFFSCGMGSLFHITGNNIRKLESENKLLGISPNAEFFETIENWQPGDALVLHSMQLARLEKEDLELNKVFTLNPLISAQRMSENLLTSTSKHPLFAAQKRPKLLIYIKN